MKTIIAVLIALGVTCWGVYQVTTRGADNGAFQSYEYATIRWGGRENTHLIRPSGKVEMLGPLLARVQRPDRTDDRTFYMNVAMNAAAKEGYEFAGMTNDEIVMKRPVAR
ncbi:MAG: hypothetical protein EXS31_07855 [Pedosphaera sp.]|nr:hypothetical protein [Pedosphaera sp.]